MSQRAMTMVDRIKSFSDEVIAFVHTLSDTDWEKICEWEEWGVGVTAYHIGAGHLKIYEMADMIVQGQPLPPLSMDQITAMSNQMAKDHANCTKSEALEQLETNRDKMIAFISNLSDQQLDLKGSMPAFDGEVTTEQLINYVVFQSAAEHFANIKGAVAG